VTFSKRVVQRRLLEGLVVLEERGQAAAAVEGGVVAGTGGIRVSGVCGSGGGGVSTMAALRLCEGSSNADENSIRRRANS
jgi:hypothetical protein